MDNGTVLIIVGGFAFAYGIFLFVRMCSSRNWAKTEGTISESYKSYSHTDAGKVEDANVRYEYVVGDKTYTSSVIKSGGDVSSHVSKRSQTDVDRLLAKYPVGTAVTVYYHPKMPKMACLEKAGGEALLICLIFGPAAMLVGYFYFWRH
jgi:hypothetical protein